MRTRQKVKVTSTAKYIHMNKTKINFPSVGQIKDKGLKQQKENLTCLG